MPALALPFSMMRIFSLVKKLTPNFVQFYKLPASKLQGVVTRLEL